MHASLQLGDIAVDVVRKDIRNVHLSVYPPAGAVRISAPLHMRLETIRVFAIAKLPWIREQQRRFHGQEREAPRDYSERETHYVWGRAYLLERRQSRGRPVIELTHRRMRLSGSLPADSRRTAALVERWYRDQVRTAVEPLLAKWTRLLDVRVDRVFVQRMKTKWGSCSRTANTIRLNAELAKKPKACLEYIVVHELLHLIEPTHNARFVALMDRAMPQWRFYRDELNRLPVRHEAWTY